MRETRRSLSRALWLLTVTLTSGCVVPAPTAVPGPEPTLAWRHTARQCYADINARRAVVYQAPYHEGRGALVGRAACDQYVEDMEAEELRRQARASEPAPLPALQVERETYLEQRLGRLETELEQEKERVTGVRSLAEEASRAAQQALARAGEVRTQRRLVSTVVVTFGFDRWELDERARSILLVVVKLLKEKSNVVVDLEGHTDAVGPATYNLQLGQRRAEAVRRFLVEQGLDLHRIHSIAFGEAHPVADNSTAAGRAQNRRSAVKIFTLAP